MAGERRKDYMVSRRVHLLYMLTWVASLALVASLVGMALSLREASRTIPEGGEKTFILVGVLAFVIVCTALALALYTIVHTHRLMGSAYRIGVVLKEINAGQDTRVHLRDGDFFTDIADEVNALADKAQGSPAQPPSPEPAEASDAPAEGGEETGGAESDAESTPEKDETSNT